MFQWLNSNNWQLNLNNMNLTHNLNEVAERARQFAQADQHREAARYRRMYRKAVEHVESNPVLNATFQLCITVGAVIGITVVLFIVSLNK